MTNFFTGQLVTLQYEQRQFEAIVIDPNGLGRSQPSIGFGFRMMAKHGGLNHDTISKWVTKESVFEGGKNNEIQTLKLPSGKALRVMKIIGQDNNRYYVLEVSQWVRVAADIINNPGKVRKPVRTKLLDFLTWFAIKGFYADAYVALKGTYTRADSRTVSHWMNSRESGIPIRNNYTRFLASQGCTDGYEYANWTNTIYKGLFGMNKKQMTEVWELVEGSPDIGRNYVPKAEGLKAIAHCEDMVIRLFHESLDQAHDDAIYYTAKKFDTKKHRIK